MAMTEPTPATGADETLEAELVISNAVEHYWNDEHRNNPMLLLQTEQRDMGRFVMDALPEFGWAIVPATALPGPEVVAAIENVIIGWMDGRWAFSDRKIDRATEIRKRALTDDEIDEIRNKAYETYWTQTRAKKEDVQRAWDFVQAAKTYLAAHDGASGGGQP